MPTPRAVSPLTSVSSGNRGAAADAIHRALELEPGDQINTYWFAVIQKTGWKAPAEALETFRKGGDDDFRSYIPLMHKMNFPEQAAAR